MPPIIMAMVCSERQAKQDQVRRQAACRAPTSASASLLALCFAIACKLAA
jgi:hypothetical protein